MDLADSTLGSAASAEATESDIAGAIWYATSVGLGQDACESDVDVSLVVKTARAFECHEVADKLEKLGQCHDRVRAAAEAAVARLGAKADLVRALRHTCTVPTPDTKKGRLQVGKRMFKTSRAGAYIEAWHVFHPGQAVLDGFYDKLKADPSPALDTETIYTCAAGSLNDATVEAAAKRVSQAFNALRSL